MYVCALLSPNPGRPYTDIHVSNIHVYIHVYIAKQRSSGLKLGMSVLDGCHIVTAVEETTPDYLPLLKAHYGRESSWRDGERQRS